MQAIVSRHPGGLESVQIADAPDPGRPKRGEIRVAMHATSLNYHDLLVANGTISTADGRILMSDGSGIVEAVGEDVSEFQVGDHVVSTFFPHWLDGLPQADVGNFAGTPGDGIDGFAAEYVVKPAVAFTLAPKGWSHVETATITTAGLTAWRALVADGGVKAGDTVLTLGTGGVSIMAAQIAKMMGATAIVTSSSDEKLERVKSLGVEHVINYKKDPHWGAHARAMTNGLGVDHIIELGGPGTLAQSFDAIRVGGHIALIGVLTGWEGNIPTALLMIKQAKLQGLIVGNRRHQQEYVKALEAAGTPMRPVIDRVYALDQLADAFKYQQSGSHFGKICVEW